MSEPVHLPKGAKPSKVAGKDPVHPILTRAEVKDGYLYATDSYCAVKLRVDLADGQVPRGVLEAAEKPEAAFVEQGETVRVELADGTVVEGSADGVGDFPDMEAIIGPEPENTFQVALNPDLLRNVAQGLASKKGVILTFDKAEVEKGYYHCPIRVTPLSGDEGVGVLMPVQWWSENPRMTPPRDRREVK